MVIPRTAQWYSPTAKSSCAAVFTVATPLHHTECIDNALLRRERNEASQRSPKGSEVRLLARSDGDRRQAKDLCDQRKTIKE